MRRFERSALLNEFEVEHGFGTIQSQDAAPPDVVQVNQVHGIAFLRDDEVTPESEADALWTRTPTRGVAVRTADCVPLLIADTRRRAVAAVHAGWKGSAANIAAHVVARLCEAIAARPDDLAAAIGPHIGPCCYEIDAPVRDAIARQDVLEAAGPGHWMLDLGALNRVQLLDAGLREARVEHVGGCTACTPGRYASYRRDGTGGRMLHYVRL